MFRILLSLLAFIMLSLDGRMAWSDDPPGKPPQNSGDLTDGLMDLLREPAKDKTNNPPAQPSTSPSSPINPNAPVMDGEDIGQPSSGPLADIQSEMSTLASWLRGQPDAARTKELQRNVVLRLDDMIAELEKQSASQSNASSPSSQSSPSQAAQSQASQSPDSSAQRPGTASNGQQPSPNSGVADNSQAGNTNTDGAQSADRQGSDRPGQSSAGSDPQSTAGQPGVSPIKPRSVNVDLNDPRALQRSAWGNLPERMREQMQSRMVERFLPPYRDEIEAYYRALVK